ncbi:hypothetical protein KUTeg_012166 [Tegillarca granosa]|uniref:Uncharacterized protein n=1 Tax=Tegillarca granosa TaxID=220873 RepID=A0ABQ9F278_TEGGR|nr:hypothetical protein KUTeg_012166 [Tegillarca granosa]
MAKENERKAKHLSRTRTKLPVDTGWAWVILAALVILTRIKFLSSRQCVIIGGLVSTLSCVISSFARDIYFLYRSWYVHVCFIHNNNSIYVLFIVSCTRNGVELIVFVHKRTPKGDNNEQTQYLDDSDTLRNEFHRILEPDLT